MKAVCDALVCNLEADYMTYWAEVSEGTPVGYFVSEEDIAAFVKSGKTTDELGASDTKTSIDGCCEVVVPKLSRVLENVNEVLTWWNTFISCIR